MAKRNKNKPTPTPENADASVSKETDSVTEPTTKPAEESVAVVDDPAKPGGEQSEKEEPDSTVPVEPVVYLVEIPNCLLGRKFIEAGSPGEAVDIYRDSVGITRHAQPVLVDPTDFDPANLPEGISLYGKE